jgi:hypothetical protein
MDLILRDLVRLEKHEVMLAIATGFSQPPFLKHGESGEQRFYKLRNLPALLELVGVQPRSIEPLMAHQYMLLFHDTVRNLKRPS